MVRESTLVHGAHLELVCAVAVFLPQVQRDIHTHAEEFALTGGDEIPQLKRLTVSKRQSERDRDSQRQSETVRDRERERQSEREEGGGGGGGGGGGTPRGAKPKLTPQAKKKLTKFGRKGQ